VSNMRIPFIFKLRVSSPLFLWFYQPVTILYNLLYYVNNLSDIFNRLLTLGNLLVNLVTA
jgi:hypothetical protein